LSAAARRWPGQGARRLAILGGARGAASLLGLATVMVVARLLDPHELGRWSLALAVQGYALHVGEFGLRSVVTTEAARAGSSLAVLMRRYFGLRLLLSLAALGAVVLGSAVARPQDTLLIGLVALSILPIALQLDWLALVDDRAGLAASLLLVRPLAFLALVGLWPGELTAVRLAACFLASWCFAAVLSWAALRRGAPAHAGDVPPRRSMLRRGAALATVTLTNQAQLSADLLVVGWSLGAAAAGDYYLASQIATSALLFANASGQIALARLPALAREPERLAAALRVEAHHLLSLACPTALALGLLAPSLVPAPFGAEHGGNAALILVLAPALALASTGSALEGFAAARAAAEAPRLAVLALALRTTLGRAAALPFDRGGSRSYLAR
jgi:PST family polysaccharide transporter